MTTSRGLKYFLAVKLPYSLVMEVLIVGIRTLTTY
jgi:hypothetical protein